MPRAEVNYILHPDTFSRDEFSEIFTQSDVFIDRLNKDAHDAEEVSENTEQNKAVYLKSIRGEIDMLFLQLAIEQSDTPPSVVSFQNDIYDLRNKFEEVLTFEARTKLQQISPSFQLSGSTLSK
jgi:hypothetical protein